MKAQGLLLCFVVASGCSTESSRPPLDERASSTASSASALSSRAEAAADEPSDAGPSAEAGAAPAPWTPFARNDDVPVCVFARYADWGEAQYLKDVKKRVALKPGRELHFGAYAPECGGPDCIRRVTLQCWADVEGRAITLHTRYSGERHVANTCTKDCDANTAACTTPVLEPGVYTVTHGQRQQTIRLPGVLQPACF